MYIHVSQVTIFSDPMVGALSALTEEKNHKYHNPDHHVFSRGQYIPIGGKTRVFCYLE